MVHSNLLSARAATPWAAILVLQCVAATTGIVPHPSQSICSESVDPRYASGFYTAALNTAAIIYERGVAVISETAGGVRAMSEDPRDPGSPQRPPFARRTLSASSAAADSPSVLKSDTRLPSQKCTEALRALACAAATMRHPRDPSFPGIAVLGDGVGFDSGRGPEVREGRRQEERGRGEEQREREEEQREREEDEQEEQRDEERAEQREEEEQQRENGQGGADGRGGSARGIAGDRFLPPCAWMCLAVAEHCHIEPGLVAPCLGIPAPWSYAGLLDTTGVDRLFDTRDNDSGNGDESGGGNGDESGGGNGGESGGGRGNGDESGGGHGNAAIRKLGGSPKTVLGSNPDDDLLCLSIGPRAPTDCAARKTCRTCNRASSAGCGWCESSGRCVAGTKAGPYIFAAEAGAEAGAGEALRDGDCNPWRGTASRCRAFSHDVPTTDLASIAAVLVSSFAAVLYIQYVRGRELPCGAGVLMGGDNGGSFHHFRNVRERAANVEMRGVTRDGGADTAAALMRGADGF